MTTPTDSARIEKIMSATLEEFMQSLAVLAGRPVTPDELPVRLAAGAGHAVVSREPRPSRRLGGLLDMPQAAVTIDFTNASPAERTEFLRRFDLAFQRGGG